ncbi:hypothetical protein [Streptomyces sp. NPDC002640]
MGQQPHQEPQQPLPAQQDQHGPERGQQVGRTHPRHGHGGGAGVLVHRGGSRRRVPHRPGARRMRAGMARPPGQEVQSQVQEHLLRPGPQHRGLEPAPPGPDGEGAAQRRRRGRRARQHPGAGQPAPGGRVPRHAEQDGGAGVEQPSGRAA